MNEDMKDITESHPLFGVKTLMVRCWHQEAAKRPDFEEICSDLEKLDPNAGQTALSVTTTMG